MPLLEALRDQLVLFSSGFGFVFRGVWWVFSSSTDFKQVEPTMAEEATEPPVEPEVAEGKLPTSSACPFLSMTLLWPSLFRPYAATPLEPVYALLAA